MEIHRIQKLNFLFILMGIICCNAFGQMALDAPKYDKLIYWASHPDKEDPADLIPNDTLTKTNAEVDVFFVYPTIYSKRRKTWNADLNDKKLQKQILKTTIKHQASVFNGAGRVYAPFYRQAHIDIYKKKKGRAQSKKALDFAYQDVKAAFEHYLKNENKGRPIIIASHSQGTNHAERLLKEYFDKGLLKNQLVVAYLIGMPIRSNAFEDIQECQKATQTSCFCSWRTFKEGTYPKKYPYSDDIAVTNPLSWETNEVKISKTRNKGSVLSKFEKGFYTELASAQVSKGILWTEKPKFPGSFLLTTNNYHIADLNFYYLSVRENAILRAKTFQARK